MKEAYLVDYARSAFTRAHPRKPEVDGWAETRGDALLARVIDALLERGGLAPDAVEEFSIGCALPVKEQWSFGGRYPLWLSQRLGPQGRACASRQIDQQCGSGLAALRSAAREIQAGAVEVAMAGGFENMTRVPMGPALFKEGVLTTPATLQNAPWLELDVALNMGLTAERLAASTGIAREEMDAFALESHRRAARAEAESCFDGERLALANPAGETIVRDANIRPDTSAERLAGLDPVFLEGGRVTAGNSSPLTSGAAATLLMSAAAVEHHGARPLARIVAFADVGVAPESMGAGAAAAAERALAQAGLRPEQIDAWEINEAFAAVPLHAMRQLGLDPARVNVWGGALALGHPLGATGVRLAGTLARILAHDGGRFGCATACVGGGQGIAVILERM
ncbi:acetyl-CoA C-acyltransferase [Halomonas sp. MCCC 1A17488]|uniref:Acetyl-CoA C-acyltransferase n=1 Tax=Billgrantia sulfidoxydans TaxID=2733484 RepID=A0ABX7W489_9GAMM|nr:MULTISPECIES: acetyl-CoA C-acyltransferase [Halomonas]MCE8015734.1 acetyl-CoA C-acyltransferase [Halomonas sp. MCCC 1A17488]MCG3239067.1 acetyl-CoA C-acyltransferase [Halomonas sp. MCCC 1A17488]QPP50984.1 acetyl-CoA C-acyltransferase [Halomonas sp. SS10-MC5]QTP54497.1 acetyl-CoA C-acyltransferase [Halomonas sulfidoxydans]